MSRCDGRALCLLVHHYQPALLARAEIRDQTSVTHQADNQNLDDSLDFSYGTNKLDAKSYETFVENEKANFKLLLKRVSNVDESIQYCASVYYLLAGFLVGRSAGPDHPGGHVQHHP